MSSRSRHFSPASAASLLQNLPRANREELLRISEAAETHDRREPRSSQLPPPGDWRTWLILAGRGFGKSFTICRWGDEMARRLPGSRGALVAATAADARDVLVEGDSGILSFYPAGGGPKYEPSKRRVTWENGSMATLFSADEPRRLRGPQFHWGICDELAHWRYTSAWDMLQFGLRLGEDPRIAAATTPLPIALVRELLQDANVKVIRGTTYENKANLARPFFDQIVKKYEGTRLGRQELNAEILEDVPGALWTRENLDHHRVLKAPADFQRIVVGVDPHASSGTTGIIVAGSCQVGEMPGGGELHGYTIADRTPPEGATPAEWGAAVIKAYRDFEASYVAAEVNHGGDMIEHVIRSLPGGLDVVYKQVRATRGKYTRAEPVAAIFEQGRGHQIGMLPALEDELTNWVPGMESPNRLDALVWAYAELELNYQSGIVVW